MGTVYIRDEDLQATLSVKALGEAVLVVLHIYAEDDIGNTLAINLRQASGSELDFVSFVEEAD